KVRDDINEVEAVRGASSKRRTHIGRVTIDLRDVSQGDLTIRTRDGHGASNRRNKSTGCDERVRRARSARRQQDRLSRRYARKSNRKKPHNDKPGVPDAPHRDLLSAVVLQPKTLNWPYCNARSESGTALKTSICRRGRNPTRPN